MRRSLVPSLLFSMLALGCGGDDGANEPGLPPLAETPAYAAILSDYSSTAIAMLRADGTVIDAQWITSGTTLPGLVATLSGDVSLPVQHGDGTMWLIDRFRTDVITRIAVPSGTILGQVRAQDSELLETGWSSNPRDLAVIDDDLAWVSRFEGNLDPAAPELERGNDLYAIHPATMTRLGRRIALSQYDVMVEGANGPTLAQARPSSLVPLDGVLLVGLSRLTGAFDGAGTGAFVEVTPATDETRLVELEGLRDCGSVARVSATRALVSCSGFARPFGDPAQMRATSGIATIDVQDGAATVTRVLRFSEHEDAPVAAVGVVPLDDDHAVAIAWGSFDPPAPDRMYEVDLATATITEIAASAGAYELGGASWDAQSNQLLVPDASVGLRRLERSAPGVYVERDSIEIAPELGLPVRSVEALAP